MTTEAARIAELMGGGAPCVVFWGDAAGVIVNASSGPHCIVRHPNLTDPATLGIIEGWCRDRGIEIVPCDWKIDDTAVLSWTIEPEIRCPLTPDGVGYMIWRDRKEALLAAVEAAAKVEL
jgi:hypothetical protein